MNTYKSFSNKEEISSVQNAKSNIIQKPKFSSLIDNRPKNILQKKLASTHQSPLVIQKKNNTGLPDNLKSGIESLSGLSVDDVNVHYNSQKPSQFNAHAYTQGSNIYLASGQEKHLPHEAWHVVQQKQGLVQPTVTINKTPVNDDPSLEKNADIMGNKALQMKAENYQKTSLKTKSISAKNSIQRMIAILTDKDDVIYTKQDGGRPAGCLPGGKQGDHTTPFTSLQNQIANAIEGVSLKDAWTNLHDTFKVYKTLPGWAESTVYTRDTLGNYVEGLITSKGDASKLMDAANYLLTLRNQIALTSLPNGGHGNAEGKWAGSLQYQEHQFQLGKTPALNKKEVLDYMWKAFDHGRVDALGDDKRNKIIKQHSITMADAYPQLNASLSIDAGEIESHYSKHKDWQAYDPG